MHKAPTHATGLLMTGPYADTLAAMSNYFKYTGEGQSWADLWEGERRWEREKQGELLFRARERKEELPKANSRVHLIGCFSPYITL